MFGYRCSYSHFICVCVLLDFNALFLQLVNIPIPKERKTSQQILSHHFLHRIRYDICILEFVSHYHCSVSPAIPLCLAVVSLVEYPVFGILAPLNTSQCKYLYCWISSSYDFPTFQLITSALPLTVLNTLTHVITLIIMSL